MITKKVLMSYVIFQKLVNMLKSEAMYKDARAQEELELMNAVKSYGVNENDKYTFLFTEGEYPVVLAYMLDCEVLNVFVHSVSVEDEKISLNVWDQYGGAKTIKSIDVLMGEINCLTEEIINTPHDTLNSTHIE